MSFNNSRYFIRASNALVSATSSLFMAYATVPSGQRAGRFGPARVRAGLPLAALATWRVVAAIRSAWFASC